MTGFFPISSEPLGFAGVGDEQPLFFDARQTLLSQYANSPVLTGIISALNFALDLRQAFETFLSYVWDVDSAEGFGLDILGRKVGVRRTLYVSDNPFLGFSTATGSQTFGFGSFYNAATATANYAMGDDVYRRVILAKAALNITSCAIPAINAVLMALFPNYGNTYVVDNGDMTMAYHFGAIPSKVDYAIATQSGVLPKPAGVSFTVEHS